MRLPLLALGTHAGVKWYAQRLPCGAVIVTVSGHLGDVHVFNQVEVASVTPAQVRAIVDAEVAEVTKRAAKRRSKR